MGQKICGSPKRYVQVLTPRTCECNLVMSLCRCNHIKNRETRSSWVNWMGSNPNENGQYKKRRRDGNRRNTENGGDRPGEIEVRGRVWG